MDKKKLRQYRSLKREQKMLEEKMEKLNERAERIPAVIGKVPLYRNAHENYNGRAQAGRYD